MNRKIKRAIQIHVYLQEHRKIQMFNGFAKRARCRTENACERDRITKTTEQHKIDCSSFANKKNSFACWIHYLSLSLVRCHGPVDVFCVAPSLAHSFTVARSFGEFFIFFSAITQSQEHTVPLQFLLKHKNVLIYLHNLWNVNRSAQ